MKLAILVLLSSIFLSAQVFADLPRNNLHLMDRVGGPSNVSEKQFNEISDAIIAIWQPIAKLHGASLVVDKRWSDPTVNAFAQQTGNTWSVTMFGGLARRPEITPDGFALVVCHELGHHFGGHFFYRNNQWAAAEGQADYFATDVCAKKVFATFYQHNFHYRMGVPPAAKEKCDHTWKTQPLQDLCYRSAAGGMSLATLLATIGGTPMPKFETPDQTKVPSSIDAHPNAQCRLDTYLAGAVCGAGFDPKVIPGKGLPSGNNSKEAEAIANKVSCPQVSGQIGARPACWFKSQLAFAPNWH